MSDDNEEGFSEAFARAYRKSSAAMGELFGGCSPWLIMILVLILVAAGIVVFVLILTTNAP